MTTTTTTKPTIVDSFMKHVSERPNDRFMTQPMGKDQECRYWTYAETFKEAKQIAHYLQSNFSKGDKIAICSKNCSWWILADLAIMMSGMVSVPVYPTLTHETVAYILEHSESKALFIGKLDEHPWSEMQAGVPENLITISFPLWPQNYKTKETWDGLLQQYEPIETIVSRDPDELATIIYTSGSTGVPKGVMHNFHAFLITTQGIIKRIHAGPKDRYVSYLPLAHGMERWLGECVALYAGVQLFFAESIDSFVQDLVRAKPTLFLSVPRLWTKFQAGVYKKLPPHKLNTLLKIPILSFFIRKKVLKGLGLDQVRVAGSGSAPIPAELITWYRSLGLELLEGYGMTENFNYSHLSLPGKCRPGYVGHAYDDVKVRIADDGEIQVQSPGQMVGYYKNPEATKEAFTEDGWLRTGDRGEIDEDGRLKITGRTKELFKTSKGKYVAPAPIENKLINHPRIELACVGGSSYPQPHAILQLNEEARKMAKTDKSAVEKEILEHMTAMNRTLDQHEQLDFVVIVKDEWLPENGFLTPTQKIVRRKIESEYDTYNDTWYAAKQKVIWHGDW